MVPSSKPYEVIACLKPRIAKNGSMFITLQDTFISGFDTSKATPNGTKAAPDAMTRAKKM